MTVKKKKVLIWGAVIVMLVGGFLALRIPSWTRTYGLSEDVIAGERMPTAEETIRLYFYYCNRRDEQAARQLLTIHMAAQPEAFALDESVENWLFVDHKIRDIYPWDNNEPEESATVMGFGVEDCEDYLWASLASDSRSLDYELRRADVNSPWRIYSIGNG
ncbi:MAG: hypothetical protein SO073_09150 [Candidatus Onthomonas sp.]|nr:hypothetical protein [Candidatus Onthomonas sp.]